MDIFFSAAGKSDPFRGGYSGGILSILENYPSIEKVYLVLTKEINELFKDNHYLERAIEDLGKRMNKTFEINIIATDIEKANNSDVLYDTFEKELINIYAHNDFNNIYVNLTSGTPQIQLVLSILCGQERFIKCTGVQVSEPIRAIKNENDPIDSKKYDFETQLELYFVMDKEFGNRCFEPKLIALNKNNFRQKLTTLLKTYNYSFICNYYKNELIYNEKANALVNHMKYRLEHNFKEAKKALLNKNFNIKDYLPFDCNTEKQEILEYYLILRVLADTEQFNDFIFRTIELMIELLAKLIEKHFYVSIEKYKTKNNYIDTDLLIEEYPDILDALKISDPNKCLYWNIHFEKVLLMELNKFDPKQYIKQLTPFLDSIDKLNTLRNDAAHRLRVLSKDDIQEIIKIDKVLDNIKAIISNIYNIQTNDQYFNIYERINKEIIASL